MDFSKELYEHKHEFLAMINAGEIPPNDVVPLSDGFCGAYIACPECGEMTVIVFVERDYDEWINGKKLLQNAFPYLSPAQRETLNINLCRKCQNKLFSSN